ncbi:hypothetical protein [Halosolutus halophilus]|uniref:hypothetical protein n=1 Tax=Halosolutus halophilus TaxID=1552990 RepID=UPI002234F404|nr:hypothetical protein [Halosolutus halophilus]
MPSRRQILGVVGTAFASGLAGCTTFQTTSGVVERKKITVGVPRTSGTPVDVSVALLTYEFDQRLVSGEHADILREVVKDGSMSVSNTVHDRLTQQFAYVHYYTNIVPMDGSQPTNGFLPRTAFNTLSIGGTAVVEPTMKPFDSYLRLNKTSPLDQPPREVRVSQYSWEDRIDGIIWR